jgi:multidrug efflux pump subunit AcrA (membrane-fusion protein)
MFHGKRLAVLAVGGMVGALALWTLRAGGQAPAHGDSAAYSAEEVPFLYAQRVTILSSEVDGLIARIDHDAQDFVPAGATLVQLDDKLARLNLEALEVNLAVNEVARQEAQVRLDYTRDNLEITQALADHPVGGLPVVGPKELKEAQQSHTLAQHAQAKARLEGEALRVEQRKTQEILSRHAIRAPHDGVVVPFSSVADTYLQRQAPPKPVEVGEAVRAGQMLMALMKVDRLQVRDSLAVGLLDRIHLGQEVQVRVEGAQDEPFTGKVVFISPTVTTAGKVNVTVEFANPPLPDAEHLPRGAYRHRFREGMRARVDWPGTV